MFLRRRALAITAGALLLGLLETGSSWAAPSPTDVTWTVSPEDGVTRTKIVLHFPGGAPGGTEIAALRKSVSAPETARPTDLLMPATVATGDVARAAGAPQGAFLYCNKFYSFFDGSGTFTFQHACGGSTGPWGIQIAPTWCAIAAGNVAEQGMSWTRNGVTMGRQASHFQPCTYVFHGTFNPDRDYDHLTYSDTFQFPVVVAGRPGTATFYVTGNFTSAGCTNGKTCGI